MTEEPDPIPQPFHTQPEIKGWPRAACAMVALGGFIAGGFATFKTDNEIGTSTLLLVGVLTGIVAILGRVPKIKIGDNEIDPGLAYQAGEAAGADRAADAAAQAALEGEEPAGVAKAARHEADYALARKALAAGVIHPMDFVAFPNRHGMLMFGFKNQDGRLLTVRSKGSGYSIPSTEILEDFERFNESSKDPEP